MDDALSTPVISLPVVLKVAQRLGYFTDKVTIGATIGYCFHSCHHKIDGVRGLCSGKFTRAKTGITEVQMSPQRKRFEVIRRDFYGVN